MIRFLRSARAAALLLLPLVAACDQGLPTVTGGTNVEGSYILSSVLVAQGGGTPSRQPVPLLLYQGPLTVNGTTFTIRYELLSGALNLARAGGTYSFTATYRITEVNGAFAPDSRTVAEAGTYLFVNGQIGFTPAPGPEPLLSPGGTLAGSELTVQSREPLFGTPGTYVFRR
ncbi:MAG TPA: hypothetical protein VF665_05775 [Longimicrobium sp.]|jgi:hypothetical protein|uniref:hypothetical protein n=1 Tax=Longimicrobium sp. TaxID=2029185 RepID=UPI002EDB9A3C